MTSKAHLIEEERNTQQISLPRLTYWYVSQGNMTQSDPGSIPDIEEFEMDQVIEVLCWHKMQHLIEVEAD